MRIYKEVPFGFCHCGCGRKTTIIKKTWKPAGRYKGQPNLYIQGHATKEDNVSRFWRNTQKADGDNCWLWTGGKDHHGYGIMGQIKAHRFAYELAYGPFDKRLGVLHKCDNPPCVRYDHLFLGTQTDNAKDMWAKGRGIPHNTPKGEAHPMSILTEKEVRKIKKLLASGVRQIDIIPMFPQVTKSCIALIAQGRNWKHIK